MKTFSEVVCKVLELKGMDILLEERKFFSCLQDLSAADFQKENRMISNSFDQNKLKTLYDAGNIGPAQVDLAEKKVIYFLQEDIGMSEKIAVSLTGEIADGIRRYRGFMEGPAEAGCSASREKYKEPLKTGKPDASLKNSEETVKVPEPPMPLKNNSEKNQKESELVHEFTVLQGNGETLRYRLDYSTLTLSVDGCQNAVFYDMKAINLADQIHYTPEAKSIIIGDEIETLKIDNDGIFRPEEYPLDRITLGRNMKELSLNNVIVSEFKVVDEHPEWYSEDGVVLSRDKKKLIAFPNARTGKYVMPDSVETICEEAFFHSRINEVVFSKNLISIGRSAFEGASALTELHLTGNIEEIGEYAFSKCTGLERVELAGKFTSTGKGTFCDCTNLQEIILGSRIQTISHRSFYGCLGLRSFAIPNTVIRIEEEAFANCRYLVDLSIPNTPLLEIHEKAMPFYDDPAYLSMFEPLYNNDRGRSETHRNPYVSKFEQPTRHEYDSVDFHGRTDFSKIKDEILLDYVEKCIKCGGDYSIFGTCKNCHAEVPKTNIMFNFQRSAWAKAGKCIDCGGDYSIFGTCKRCKSKRLKTKDLYNI